MKKSKHTRKQLTVACAAHQLLERRIRELMRERAFLEEEIRQLRAAVQIWTVVAEQTALPAGASRPRELAVIDGADLGRRATNVPQAAA